MNPLLIRRRGMMQAAAAPLPDGQLEWIATDGVAYIDTGVAGGYPKSAKMTCQLPQSPTTGYIMAAYYGSSTTTRRFVFASYVNSDTTIRSYYHTNDIRSVSCANSVANNTPFDLEIIMNRNHHSLSILEQGGTWVTDSSSPGTNSNGTATILFFAAHGDNGITGNAPSGTRIMAAEIYSDATYTTIVRNYVPWRLNGEVGLMDTLTNTFYGNAAGNGAFIGGPNVI